jgi:hypothetical protein
MLRVVLSTLTLALLWPAVAGAVLDPESTKPYQLQVVLQVAGHRLLTPIFQDQVRRELRDSLQAALGDLAGVEIVNEHPLLKLIENVGLQRALNGWKVVSGTKTHFLFLSFANGLYELQARQYDGLTGLASPVVRQAQTPDRQLVARTAALLIDQDFGMVGTITKSEGDKVDIVLKGGALGVPLDHWVKKDDVFAIARLVTQPGAEPRSERVDWALLQVIEEARDGLCRCRLYHRRPNPLASGPQVAGYRCLKLGTIESQVRLRLLSGDKLGTPSAGLQVRVSAHGFLSNPVERIPTNAEGLVTTQQRYRNVAFVVISASGEPVAQVPVEVVDDRPIPIEVNVREDADQRGQLSLRCDRWIRRAFDSLDVANSMFRGINESKEAPRAVVKAKAQAGLRRLQADIVSLSKERNDLRDDAAKMKYGPLDLGDGEKGLQDLESQRDALQRYIAELDEVIVKETDPQRKKWKERAQQASLLENDLQFAQAIELYEQVLSQGADDPKLRKHLETLKQGWALKGDKTKHQKARSFIYEAWPLAETLAKLKATLPEAQEAFATCQAVGDYLTPQMLHKVNLAHRSRILKELDALSPQEKDDDRKTAETILTLDAELKKFNQEVADFVAKAKPREK